VLQILLRVLNFSPNVVQVSAESPKTVSPSSSARVGRPATACDDCRSAGRAVARRMSTVKDIAMVTTALKMVLWWRDHGGRRVGDGSIHQV